MTSSLSLSSHAGRRAASRPADLVLRNGAIYTMCAARTWADAIAIENGRIVYVGGEAEAESFIGSGTRVIDLGRRMVLPGFHDSHVHPIAGGLELGECNLTELETPEEIAEGVRRCAALHSGEHWIRGSGWQLPVFPEGNPSKTLLDRIVPDRPAYLVAADGHSAWVNSRALALAGITRETPDPPHGRIERDPASGEPSGTLRESAMDLVGRLLPEYTAEEYLAGLKRALALANQYGITSLYEANADGPMLEAYAELQRRGELSARVTAAVGLDSLPLNEEIARLKEWRTRFAGPRIRTGAVKLFADGVIEARTAAMLQPYTDRPGDRGTPNYRPQELDRLVDALDREGFQIHVHAIGDRAIRQTLDALEHARVVNGARDSRHLIAHVEVVDAADIPRFRELGVLAVFQPLWAQADEYITKLTEPALGPERSRWLYPIGSLARSGAVVVGGSDWSVSSMNPLEAIQVAVTRRAPDHGPGPAWIPEERAELSEMVAAYTLNGAYAIGLEQECGSLEVGKSADLVVLDRNLFAVPPWEIHRATVLMTMLEGKTVHCAGME